MAFNPKRFDLLDELVAQLSDRISPLALLEESGGIAPETTFLEWVEDLATKGLKVDGRAFTFAGRAALREIYASLPSTIEEAHKGTYVIMKGAQTGLTVMELLYSVFIGLKWMPLAIGLYVPDRSLAGYKSSERFMPVLRTIPDAYKQLVVESGGRGKASKEGNVLTRTMGASRFLFLWTSGRMVTESFPLDVVTFDEVQGMTPADVEKVVERMSASIVKLALLISTAMWPDADIDYWFKMGDQRHFHARCGCHDGVVLIQQFPACIQYNGDQTGEGRQDENFPPGWQFQCQVCKTFIPDTNNGEWRAHNPDGEFPSWQFPQVLSSTVSAEDIIKSYRKADDLQNFYNRKLGIPYQDPSQIPVNLEMLNAAAVEGMRRGVVWKTRARGTLMGIDQMGAFNVVIIKERLADGHQATIHVEAIYDDDPFARCDELMASYGVQVCVVETLPNYNDAKRFAKRHKGKVFLASYSDIEGEMVRWGDTEMTKAKRKIAEDDRDRYTVVIDQYKMMQVALARLSSGACLFPDPDGLIQEVVEKGTRRMSAILKEMAFLHFTKVALVVTTTEQGSGAKKMIVGKKRRKVMKVGIDPHFAYANMLCDVAWARAYGTSTFILPEGGDSSATAGAVVGNVANDFAGLPGHIAGLISTQSVDLGGNAICGNCEHCGEETMLCGEINAMVAAKDPACPFFDRR